MLASLVGAIGALSTTHPHITCLLGLRTGVQIEASWNACAPTVLVIQIQTILKAWMSTNLYMVATAAALVRSI